MALAAERDSVAREYATDFARHVRDRRAGAPRRARRAGLDWSDAAVEAYLAPARGGARHPHRPEAGPGRGGGGLPPGRARCEQPAASAPRRADGRWQAFDAELREPDQHAATRAPPRT